MESKTIRVKSGGSTWTTRFNITGDEKSQRGRCVEVVLYDLPGDLLHAMQTHDVDITITPVASPEERLREARRIHLAGICAMNSDEMRRILDAVEIADSEFAKGEGSG